MTKNNLKIVKSNKSQEAETKEKNKALEAAISQIDENFGKGSVMKLGQKAILNIESISTGSLSLDLALGIGGLPKGRVVEIYGPESSGKTTLALQVVAEAQKTGGICGFIDAEHALDPVYAKKLGVKTEELLISQPDTGEQALEIADTLIKSGSISVLVIDSVAALTPRAELEGEMGDHHVGLQSRLMSQALRKLTSSIAKTNTMVIFINQIRMKIGIMFGNPETTSGGNALKFYSSVRMDIRRIGAIKEKEQIIGNSTRVKVVKKESPTEYAHRYEIKFSGDMKKVADFIEDIEGVEILSIGNSLELIKDLGDAAVVSGQYGLDGFNGTHGIGHTRMATESDVDIRSAHPYWAYQFSDVAEVHNGQLTNYWTNRRALERKGHRFSSNCDSELIAVYIADRMNQGDDLETAMKNSVEYLDGVFTYLVATQDELGMAKDVMAAKPMVVYEGDDMIALASEEVAIRKLFDHHIETFDPYHGEVRVWQH